MILFWLLAAFLVATTLVVLLVRFRQRGTAKSVIFVLGVVLLIAGIVASYFEVARLVDARVRMNWQTVKGIVLQSGIAGERALRPQVIYQYEVNGTSYTGESDLGAPPFGNKRKRLEAAEKIVAEYPEGKAVTVYYNPEQPSHSTLIARVPWNFYMQIALAVTGALAGAVLLMIFGVKRGGG